MDRKDANTGPGSNGAAKAPRSPYKAALYCLMLGAGAGQIYNGQKRKGFAMMALFFAPVCYACYLILAIYAGYWHRAMAGDLGVIAEFVRDVRSSESIATNSSFAGLLWIISIVDGFVSARLINKKIQAAAEAGAAGSDADTVSRETAPESGAEN